MKKLISTILLVALIPIMIFAHPAKKVEATYNQETGKIKVVATHNVSDPTTHYIKTITVTVDGKLVKTLNYTSQTDKNTQQDEVVIPEIKKGCTVVVNTVCNKFGTKATTITI
jgi:uncharacterized GH25 family protein